MDEKKIAFIMCTNNEEYCEECKKYINDLSVPDGYSVDIVEVKGATSMAAGYNKAMNGSDAKYKIYLHQDVFILNENLIFEMLDAFKDESIGMLGVLGCVEIIPDADYLSAWHVGKVEVYNANNYSAIDLYQNEDKTPVEVSAIDGMLMITQYDVLWREDEFDAFDFYDISQSVEMCRAGYKIVIPYQEKAWAYHDMRINRLENYDVYRQKMLNIYSDIFDGNFEEKYQTKEKNKLYDDLKRDMIKLIEMKRYDELVNLSNEIREMYLGDTVIREINNLMQIYSEESNNGTKHSRWYECTNWSDIYREYRRLQFLALRMGYQKNDDRLEEYRRKILDEIISIEAVIKVANSVLPNSMKFVRKLFINK